MKIKSICWLLLVTMSKATVLFAQGNGSTHHHNVCTPIIIDGERNPTPGEVETYTHHLDAHQGEQFVWTVEGASSLDGVSTDQDGNGTLTKYGATIEVIWDDQSNKGRISVSPLNPCAQIRKQGGGVVVNKAGCATPLISDASTGADRPCAGETHTYTFNYPSLQTSAGNYGCNELEWVVKGVSEVTITGRFGPIPTTGNCVINYQSYTHTITIPDPNSEFTINEAYFGYTDFSNSCTNIANGIPGDHIEVTFADGVGEATIEARGFSCGTAGVGCGTQSTKRTLNVGVNAVTDLIGPSTVNCGSNGILYIVEGGEGGDITWFSLNPDWTFDPVYYTVNIPFWGSVQAEYKDRFYLNTNNSGSGAIWIRSSNLCEDVAYAEVVNVGSSGLPSPTGITKSPGGSICHNGVLDVTVDDLGAGYEYQWEVSNNGVITQTYTTTYNYLHLINPGTIDRVRVRHLASCGYSDWEEIAVDIIAAPEPFRDITLTGSICAGGQTTFEVLDESNTHGTYEWDIWYSGSIPNTYSSGTAPVLTLPVPGDTDGEGVQVQVTTHNGCSSTAYQKIFDKNRNTVHIAPDLIMPDKYCGGFSNTFKVSEITREKGAFYRWAIVSNIGTESADGYEMYTFTPDFEESATGNSYPKPGLINDFSITLEVKYTCSDNWAQVASETVNLVVYNGCNAGGTGSGTLSIRLVPNPTSDHVMVEFPTGGKNRNIRIVDAYGAERRNESTTSASHHMNIQDLPLGVYTVIATEGNEVVTEHLQIIP